MTVQITRIAEPLAAYCAFLRATIGEHLAQATNPATPSVSYPAVFRPSMPAWFDANMPVAALVCRPAGGSSQFGKTLMPLADPRVDVIAYGTTPQQATELCRLVGVVSKQLTPSVWENTLLAACNIAGGPVPLPDEQTLWPGCWLSVQLVHGELPVQ